MLLGVNIDHVATLRNARRGSEPSVIEAAKICMAAGAYAITAHLREDRRHITDDDIIQLKELDIPLNMEMAATLEMKDIVLKVLPESCCIVPEKRLEVTTEGGLNVSGQKTYLKEYVKPLIDAGIKVSLFISPDRQQIYDASDIGVEYIELHTGAYSLAFGTNKEEEEFLRLKSASSFGNLIGLNVNAGHGLNYENVSKMHEMDNINELNIGHSIISRAVFTGLDKAVRDMIQLVNKN